MGFAEVLTIVFIVLKLLNVIAWSWWVVVLPEIIAFVFYIIVVILGTCNGVTVRRKFKSFRK